jgi:hypothetical protein
MSPIVLLALFALLALGAFAAFTVLTYLQTTPRREDWKKFLSSFAGTTLGLSVGFISFMLQQQSQSAQTATAEQQQIKRKLDEENGQIRARLLYSITQKRFELIPFMDFNAPNDRKAICDKSVDRSQREQRFQRRNNRMEQTEYQVFSERVSQLFSTQAYERNSLLRLMRETSLPMRISEGMLGKFLENELALQIVAPSLLTKILKLGVAGTLETYCTDAEALARDHRQLIENTTDLQLSSCAAFAVVGLPISESIDKSSNLRVLINGFRLGSDESGKFLASLEEAAGAAKSDFQRCMAVAKIKLDVSF